MGKLKFYTVDKPYLDFLQYKEKSKRGFTRVPNHDYDTNEKFVCGVVFEINNRKYYAPMSSYTKKQNENILIEDKHGDVKSSIRFNYMFPVPDECLEYKDFNIKPDSMSEDKYNKYKSLLNIEYEFCVKNESKILNRAKRTYTKVTNGLMSIFWTQKVKLFYAVLLANNSHCSGVM
ncbi:type III toxin-antitoxin system ToxN/AbiQ family toxin [uncultured Clostridium sp.]|uniref:type III toxin-antitoxin system ToxN/AbiQ family toxin n=1 Tax=uncultured Clostridium sp. TaxID=59620 RepID=UPI0025F41EBD|nr:type III toxin-antitoxin system ToxN/AbiQ family toxin [uncultured Clostridium sp.]